MAPSTIKAARTAKVANRSNLRIENNAATPDSPMEIVARLVWELGHRWPAQMPTIKQSTMGTSGRVRVEEKYRGEEDSGLSQSPRKINFLGEMNLFHIRFIKLHIIII